MKKLLDITFYTSLFFTVLWALIGAGIYNENGINVLKYENYWIVLAPLLFVMAVSELLRGDA